MFQEGICFAMFGYGSKTKLLRTWEHCFGLYFRLPYQLNLLYQQARCSVVRLPSLLQEATQGSGKKGNKQKREQTDISRSSRYNSEFRFGHFAFNVSPTINTQPPPEQAPEQAPQQSMVFETFMDAKARRAFHFWAKRVRLCFRPFRLVQKLPGYHH